MNILVLAGGLSPERDVSLSSGSLIANALTRSGHSVFLADVYEGTAGLIDPAVLFSARNAYSYSVAESEPNLAELIRKNGGRIADIGPGIPELCGYADVVFVALHGAAGENGKIQAYLDSIGACYTGTGYAGSFIAMNKDIAKRLMEAEGIPTPEWILCETSKFDPAVVSEKIGFPCVIKPCACGSSVGVSMVNNAGQLDGAIGLASEYEKTVICERRISGREFSVGILLGRALPPIEIIPHEGFYDYKNKYQAGLTEEVCPAPLSSEKTEEIKRLALAVFTALRLQVYARVDFILGEDGVFYCLEANTLPGMTPTSLLPQEAAADGIPYERLCEIIAENAPDPQKRAAGE